MPMLSPSMQPTAADLLPKGRSIASYSSYAAAQEAVDYLSDESFPVQNVTIVGTGLQLIENVTGRLSYPRMALNGAATGAQFGLMVGILMSLVNDDTAMLQSIVIAVGLGIAIGMIFAVLSYGFTRGKRDFTSMSHVLASEYTLVCHEDHAAAAMKLLREGGKADVTAAAPRAEAPAAIPAVDENTEPEKATDSGDDARPAQGGRRLTYGEAIDQQRRKERERRAAENAGTDLHDDSESHHDG